MTVFLLFCRQILNQEMCCFGFFQKIKSKTKALFEKKKKGERLCCSGKVWFRGCPIMLPSSCLAGVLLESLRGCIMRGKNEKETVVIG